MTQNSSCTQAEINILARTIYGEARGEYKRIDGGVASFIAIANVVMNRLSQKTWYGTSIREVCQKPFQFSCWNPGDPNRDLLVADVLTDPVFYHCYDVALKVANGLWPDLTEGCDHYHAHRMTVYPKWSRGVKPKIRIGGHVFYRLRRG